ncbi:MAG: hypothetical protein ACYCSS_07580 [Sulfuriferula sp.]
MLKLSTPQRLSVLCALFALMLAAFGLDIHGAQTMTQAGWCLTPA